MACMYAAHHDWPCTAHAHTASNSIPTQHRDATDWPCWLALTPHSVAARCPPACPPGPAVSSIATGFLAFSGCSLVRAVVVPGSASHAMVMSLLHGGQRWGPSKSSGSSGASEKSLCLRSRAIPASHALSQLSATYIILTPPGHLSAAAPGFRPRPALPPAPHAPTVDPSLPHPASASNSLPCW